MNEFVHRVHEQRIDYLDWLRADLDKRWSLVNLALAREECDSFAHAFELAMEMEAHS